MNITSFCAQLLFKRSAVNVFPATYRLHSFDWMCLSRDPIFQAILFVCPDDPTILQNVCYNISIC